MTVKTSFSGVCLFTVVYMSEERYMSEETHTEKLVLAVTKTYDYCDMSQETLKWNTPKPKSVSISSDIYTFRYTCIFFVLWQVCKLLVELAQAAGPSLAALARSCSFRLHISALQLFECLCVCVSALGFFSPFPFFFFSPLRLAYLIVRGSSPY